MDSLPTTLFTIETGTLDPAGYYRSWQLLEAAVYSTLEQATQRLRSWAANIKLLDRSYEVSKESYAKDSIASTFVDFKERGQSKRAQIFPVFLSNKG